MTKCPTCKGKLIEEESKGLKGVIWFTCFKCSKDGVIVGMYDGRKNYYNK